MDASVGNRWFDSDPRLQLGFLRKPEGELQKPAAKIVSVRCNPAFSFSKQSSNSLNHAFECGPVMHTMRCEKVFHSWSFQGTRTNASIWWGMLRGRKNFSFAAGVRAMTERSAPM